MVVSRLTDETSAISDRVRRTVALLRRRGYALDPSHLGQICLGGHVSELEVRWAAAAAPDLAIAEDLVVERDAVGHAGAIRARAASHGTESLPYLALTRRFVRRLVMVAPFIRSVSIAGSLASGGFRETDDVDLNLVVDDGFRHLAYVAVNTLGLVHAMGHRAKPVDDLTRRPIAPRLMTANLILERSQCHPLVRQDEDMAFELLMSETVFGGEEIAEIIRANPALVEHFPQLALRPAPAEVAVPWRLPRALYPSLLDPPARLIGRAAWMYMQWTRRGKPDALARVAFVRATMRPYTLFDVT